MTLETCKKRLEIAKKYDDLKEIKLWEERIAIKEKLPKYMKKEEPKKKGKKK